MDSTKRGCYIWTYNLGHSAWTAANSYNLIAVCKDVSKELICNMLFRLQGVFR